MLIGKRKVVIDTNVVISAVVSKYGNPAKIIERLISKDFENYASPAIITEIKSVLERENIRRYASYEYRKFLLENFIVYSILVLPMFDEKAVVKDETDNMFINCALSANADIVSGDGHLLDLKKYKDVSIFTPREFLESLK